jgi:purine-binding chemotaxis protein CheW
MSDITSQQLVVFSLGSEEYALPIGAVHEIIRYTEPRTVASESAWIRGVIGLRGKIIPIFDLAARMEIESLATGPGKIVIVETGTGQVGVMVDEVEEVLTVSSDQLEHVPTARRESIEAIAKIEDRLVILLNAEGLFARAPAEDAAA